MKKKKGGAIVTAVIVVLILVIAGFGVRSYIQRNQPLPAGAGGQRPAGGGGAQTARNAVPQAQGAARPQGGENAQAQRPAGQNPGAGSGAQGGRVATAVRVTPVVKGTIENSVVINGDVLAVNQVSIYPTVGGKISEMLFQVGDRVSQGTVVAMVDPSRPGQIYSDSPVASTISGTVLQTPVRKGDTVSTQTAVLVVGDLTSLMVETFVPERFSNAARQGLPAQVSLEALPGEAFGAVVEEVSPVLDPSSRTLRIRLRFAGQTDTRIKAGMFATVSLVTNIRRDVPVIPRQAVINTYGSWVVFTVNDRNIVSRKTITLGLENENSVEVLQGLELGDIIVSAGQNFLSDGDPVRIVD